MPGISNRRQGELLRAVFQVLLDHPDGLPAREVLEKMSVLVPFNEYESGHYPSSPNEPRAMKATRFWTVNAVKAGWLIKNKGVWRITDEGRAAFERFPGPEEFIRESSRLYQEWKRSRPKAEPAVDDIEQRLHEDEAVVATSVEEAEEQAWSQLRTYLTQMDPFDFQELVAALLRAMDYHVAWISPPGPDRGLDVLAYTDPLGATGPRIKVQVKRRQDRMNVDGVRAFMAILGDQDVGIFVSTGGFTSEAEREVRDQERWRITLLDLGQLFDLWVEHYEAIDESKKILLPLKPVYFLAPVD